MSTSSAMDCTSSFVTDTKHRYYEGETLFCWSWFFGYLLWFQLGIIESWLLNNKLTSLFPLLLTSLPLPTWRISLSLFCFLGNNSISRWVKCPKLTNKTRILNCKATSSSLKAWITTTTNLNWNYELDSFSNIFIFKQHLLTPRTCRLPNLFSIAQCYIKAVFSLVYCVSNEKKRLIISFDSAQIFHLSKCRGLYLHSVTRWDYG